MQVTLCDWRTEKGEPCGERASILVSLTLDGKKYEADFCDVHSKQIATNAREASSLGIPAGYNKVTQVKASGARKPQEQLVEKVDYVDLRAWLEAQGDLPAGSRGRISQTLQQKWIDAGEPRPV